MSDLNIKGATYSSLGIFGGALTIFSNLETVLKFADWARRITSTWNSFLEFVWSHILTFINIKLHVSTQFQVSMAVSMILMALGAYFVEKNSQSNEKPWKIKIGNVLRWNVILAIFVYSLSIYLSSYFLSYFDIKIDTLNKYYLYLFIFYLCYAIAIFVGVSHWPVSAAIVTTLSAIIISHIFQSAAEKLSGSNLVVDDFSLIFGACFSIVAAIFTLLIAPPRLFSQRLVYLLIIIGFLVCLNQISIWEINLAA